METSMCALEGDRSYYAHHPFRVPKCSALAARELGMVSKLTRPAALSPLFNKHPFHISRSMLFGWNDINIRH